MKAVSSTSLSISWNKVPETERNGNITHYEIVYTPVNSPLLDQQPKISTTGGPALVSILEGLEEYTMYNVSVRAVTIVGSGPLSPPQMDQTLEDGKQMLTLCMCSQYHLSLNVEREWYDIPSMHALWCMHKSCPLISSADTHPYMH